MGAIYFACLTLGFIRKFSFGEGKELFDQLLIGNREHLTPIKWRLKINKGCMVENSVSGNEKVDHEEKVVDRGFKQLAYKLPAILSVLFVVSFLLQASASSVLPMLLSTLCFVGMVVAYLVFTLFALYRSIASSGVRSRAVAALVAWLALCASSIRNTVEGILGDFKWEHVQRIWEMGDFDTVLVSSIMNSAFFVVVIHLCVMLAFKNKRNVTSILNVTLYWSIALLIYTNIDPIRQAMFSNI